MENKLVRLTEFEAALNQYRLSDTSRQTLASTPFVMLVAPTSTGRNTIIRELLQTGGYHYVVSDTTRHPRTNDGVPETDGVEYWFRSEDEVLADIQAGKFVEAAIIHNQQVSGISIRELERAGTEGKIAITDIEVQGVKTIMRLKPDALPLFVLPPSFKQWMKRLELRGRMSDEERQRRMQSAAKEMEAALQHDYYLFVINDTVEQAVKQIQAIAKDKKIDQEMQKQARQLAEKLYAELTGTS